MTCGRSPTHARNDNALPSGVHFNRAAGSGRLKIRVEDVSLTGSGPVRLKPDTTEEEETRQIAGS